MMQRSLSDFPEGIPATNTDKNSARNNAVMDILT